MSQENVARIREAFAAFERGDLGAILDLMTEDLITRRVDHYRADYRGKEGFLQAMAEWSENFVDWSITVTEYLDAGDAVVARVHQSARGKGSGVPIEGDFWFVFEFRGKRVATSSYYVDEAQALEAVGLSE